MFRWISEAFRILRGLRRQPRFMALAILGLALGVGVNTAVFSALYTVLLRPLPFNNQNRLFFFFEQNAAKARNELSLSYPSLMEWRQRSASLEGLSGAAVALLTLNVGGQPEVVKAALVSSDFFDVLGVAPHMGRWFSDLDQGAAPPPAEIVISHRFWKSRFGGNPDILGQTIYLGDNPFTVIGIAHPEVETPGGTQVWVPLAFTPALFPNIPGLLEDRNARLLRCYARLTSSLTRDQAQQDLDRIAQQLTTEFPESNQGITSILVPYRERAVRGFRQSLLILQTIAVIVLLIVCANFFNLLLARGIGRAKEIAMRSALGASPANLCREVLMETSAIALLGAVVGTAVAYVMLKILISIAPPELPYVTKIRIEFPVLVTAIVGTIAAGVLAGIVPALRARNVDIAGILKSGMARNSRRSNTFLNLSGQYGLIIAETTLTVIMLTISGLLIHSYYHLQQIDSGFSPSNTVALSVSLAGDRYPEQKDVSQFFGGALELISQLPGVEAVTAASDLPLQGVSCSFTAVSVGDVSLPEPRELPCQAVAPSYVETLGVPLLVGRTFAPGDYDSANVIIVNKKTADVFWPLEDPIGKTLIRDDGVAVEVVGVIGNIRHSGIRQEPTPTIYLPEYMNNMSIIMHTTGDPIQLVDSAKKAVWKVDSGQPIYSVSTLETVVADETAAARFNAYGITFLGGFSMLIAALGIFGVLSYYVSQQYRHIAIRMALGARSLQVSRLVVGRALALTAGACVAGLILVKAVGALLESLLYGVSLLDPLVLILVPVLVIGVSLLATLVPARRAARVDPAVNLRIE